MIAEPSKPFSTALWEYFYDIPNVQILVADLNDIVNLRDGRNHVKLTTEWIPDALIFEGNMHGIKDSSPRWQELTQYISFSHLKINYIRIFGTSICEKIRDFIKVNYLGQAPLYTSFVVKTSHPVLKYLIYTASNSRKVESRHSFSALWSAFACIQSYNKTNEQIGSFLCKGFLTGSGTRVLYQRVVTCFRCRGIG